MPTIEQFGFKEVGRWRTRTERDRSTAPAQFQVDDAVGGLRVVYCFTVDGDPAYFGICDAPGRSFRDRLNRYRLRTIKPRKGIKGDPSAVGGTTGTAARVLKALREGRDVRIHCLVPETKLEFAGLELDLVRGLEYPLIQTFPQVWNRAGRPPGTSRSGKAKRITAPAPAMD